MRPTFTSTLAWSSTFAALLACAAPPRPAATVSPAPPPPPPPAVTPTQPVAAPPTVVFPMIPQATCVLRGAGQFALPLTLRGETTIDVVNELEWVEAHLSAGEPLATVVGRTSTLDFAAHVWLVDVSYTPTTRSLRDGWIFVENAHVKEVTPEGELVGEARVPYVVSAGSSRFVTRHGCGEVVLGWHLPSRRAGDIRVLRYEAKGTLRDAPNGRVLARLWVPPQPPPGNPRSNVPFYATLLEQRGSMVKISITDMDATVEAWTEASVLEPKPPSSIRPELPSGPVGPLSERKGVATSTTTCSRPVTVYVHDKDRPVPIAAFRPGAAIRRVLDAKPEAPGEIPVLLWRPYHEGTVPFVLESDLATCNTSQPDRAVVTAVPGRGLVLGPPDAQ